MQRTLLTRGLQCLATASESGGEPSLAIQYATAVLDLEPFRETAYQQLMRLHATMGNPAEALRVFGQCRSDCVTSSARARRRRRRRCSLKILRAGEMG